MKYFLRQQRIEIFRFLIRYKKLYNSDFIGYGVFERYQQYLLELFQISEASRVINEFKLLPSIKHLKQCLQN